MTTKAIRFGRPVATDGVPNVYAGAPVVPWTPPEPGIDNLGIDSIDTFAVPGVGEYTVAFKGWVRVVRSPSTSQEWANAEVYTNLIEMKMVGECEELGQITVTLNPDCLSAGQIRTPFDPYAGEGPAAKACRMAVGAIFDMPKLGLKLINREPIILTIDDVRSIPPAGAPGKGQIYRMMPLLDINDPDGQPVAYLTSLRFNMGGYLAPDEL
ncbi:MULTISPECIES: DUF6073 family protein [Micromonospora]|uniref:Uncharacterized protein n=1 Tax=Micromonospora yangpuensis TaxID=683228 RepID=A0A1C6UU91_9ACTN|nr:DUF6073 family protein [Micromonospora yangpuensis]GGM24376.1 hypothetical protein GCM10012279_48380 [Micromonospora yangpuensis]SCL57561.1 hypothetical protein GA0070617_3562 [Micromonospora yangpuensis]